MKRFLAVLSLAFLAVAQPNFCPAAPCAVLNTMTRAELLTFMQKNGFSVAPRTGTGDLAPREVVWTINGYTTYVDVATDGTDLLFDAAFTFDQKKFGTQMQTICNNWNTKQRFSASYIDNKGVWLELDLEIGGGITEANLLNFLQKCQNSFGIWTPLVVSPTQN